MFGPEGMKIGMGQDSGSAPPRMLMMVAAKPLDDENVSVHFKLLGGAAKEKDFLMIAAAVLRELKLRAGAAAQADGRKPMELEKFVDTVIEATSVSQRRDGKQAGEEAR